MRGYSRMSLLRHHPLTLGCASLRPLNGDTALSPPAGRGGFPRHS
ncbi:hypothetical protein SAMN02799631_06412, partial [Methylobacterium sp. 174MFSha1.1]